MNGLPVELLKLLNVGGIRSTAELARRLEISEGLLGMLVEDLTRRGYLAPLDQGCSSGCNTCGLAATCHVPATPRPAILSLTPRGKQAALKA